MGIQRSAIFDGPGSAIFGTQNLFAKDTITANVNIENWRPDVITHGKGTPRISDATGEIQITPSGRISTELLDIFYPAALRTFVPNTSLFAAGSDTPLKLWGVDGKWVQFTNAAITGLPDLDLSPKGTAFGQATFTALIADGADRTAAGSFYTTGTTPWTGTLADSDIVSVPYTGTWNNLTFWTADGWKVNFELETENRYIDGIGTVKVAASGLIVKATCRPANIDTDTLIGLLRPEGLALGSSMAISEDLVIAGAAGGLTITLKNATLTTGPANWGKTELHAGEIGFESKGMGDIFTIGVVS